MYKRKQLMFLNLHTSSIPYAVFLWHKSRETVRHMHAPVTHGYPAPAFYAAMQHVRVNPRFLPQVRGTKWCRTMPEQCALSLAQDFDHD